MIYKELIIALSILATFSAEARDRLLLLGDIHLDRIENHDMEWLATKGDNMRQVTKEYTVWTQKNFPVLAHTVSDVAHGAAAVIQLGDLSEGLAGTPEKAVEMALDVFSIIDSLRLTVPFIMTKGNHDITGPGAKDAFNSVYLPAMSRLSARTDTLHSATYSTMVGSDIQIVCYDPWDRQSTPAVLDSLLKSSSAKHKFIALHEPVIPVNHRCWHVYRKDNELREQLLKTIAQNRAIVLCAHLHKYSVVSRDTPWGPVTQILVNSVIRNLKKDTDPEFSVVYDQSMFDGHESWEPATIDQRRQWIESEIPHINFYRYADIPGYATLDINDNIVVLKYYYGADTQSPIDIINISKIHCK